jgi:protein-tyrosine phosphatase
MIDLNADSSEKSLSKAVRACYHPIKIIGRYGDEVWMKKVQRVVHVIDQAVPARKKVYLHCTYGRGRSATVAMAYLISKNWPVNEAIDHVKAEGRLVWCEGNPVSKYERILRLYSYSKSRPGAGER